MNAHDIKFKFIKPDPNLSDYVESFWMLMNHADTSKEIIVLPDGRVDLIFAYSNNESFHTTLIGIGTEPDQAIIAPGTVMFAVSFKLLAAEYILNLKLASLLNKASLLPNDFWNVSQNDLKDIDRFCKNVSKVIIDLKKEEVDPRKKKLFDLIYSSHGTIAVQELSEQVNWSSRQINRYFNEHFGLPLKAYCNILRFRASFDQIKEGKLFPEQAFADQAHFIKEVKKFSGVAPKELFKNQNDRFIQFSTLQKK
jgi:AraC-like DNA-binding protein